MTSDMAHFKLEAKISGLMCSFNAGEELEFRYESFPPVVVSLKQLDRIGNAICTATTVKDVEPEIKAELDSCLEDGYVKTSELKPDTLKTIDDIKHHVRAVSRSTVIMFNWTHGLDGPPNSYGPPRAFYSEDGNRWFQFAQATRGSFNTELASRLIYARDVRVDQVVRKVELGCEEPLGRQLFREAWQQIEINPRGALVIGVAAAEVGLKRLIGTLIPGAKMPSAKKIMRKLLPTLPATARWRDGRPITLPLELIERVEDAFELRNEVVHVGAPPPSQQELASMLRAISDLLWICDVLLGEHWAMKHVSSETRTNWPSKSS
jgi:hypothetical protein